MSLTPLALQTAGRVGPAPSLMRKPGVSGTAVLVALGFLACVLEGAGRKWLVQNPSFVVQGIFYFGKDIFFILAALLAIQTPARSAAVVGLKSTLAMSAGLIFLATLVNLDNFYPIGALVSVRNALYLPWLALLIAPALRSQRDIDFLLKLIGFTVVGVAVLGGLQFYLPRGHILNQQVNTAQEALAEGARVRASGTFAFISGMADLAILAAWAGVCLLLRRQRTLGSLFVAAALACASAAVSRTGILGALAVVIFSYLLLPSGRRDMVIVILVLGLGFYYVARDQQTTDEFSLASSTVFRFRTAGDTFGERIFGMIEQPWLAVQEVPAGVGLGLGQSVGAMMKAQLPTKVAFESELARIVLEIGVFGLIAVVIMRVSVIATLWTTCRSARPEFLPIRLASLVAVGLYFASVTYFGHVASTFAWLVVLVALATCELETRAGASSRRLRQT